jgi:cation diffusion facilitator family transporter
MMNGERFALGSIAAGCLVLGLKGAAWWLTGSAALYSDALESTVNVAASLVAWLAISFAARPADDNHPYGHDKAEFFAAVLEGLMIVVAAVLIFSEAWQAWQHPRPIGMPFEGIGLNALATLINAGWSAVLLSAGRRLRSIALEADGRHLMADVVTSAGIAAGMILAVSTGRLVLDPLLAGATGLYVLWSGVRMISTSVSGLMDTAPEPAVMQRIRELVATSASGAIEAHDLRTRHAGKLTFLDFHLVVPGSMTVAAAHSICDRIESTLKAEMGHLMITIHVEPEEKAKRCGIQVPPDGAAKNAARAGQHP